MLSSSLTRDQFEMRRMLLKAVKSSGTSVRCKIERPLVRTSGSGRRRGGCVRLVAFWPAPRRLRRRYLCAQVPRLWAIARMSLHEPRRQNVCLCWLEGTSQPFVGLEHGVGVGAATLGTSRYETTKRPQPATSRRGRHEAREKKITCKIFGSCVVQYHEWYSIARKDKSLLLVRWRHGLDEQHPEVRSRTAFYNSHRATMIGAPRFPANKSSLIPCAADPGARRGEHGANTGVPR